MRHRLPVLPGIIVAAIASLLPIAVMGAFGPCRMVSTDYYTENPLLDCAGGPGWGSPVIPPGLCQGVYTHVYAAWECLNADESSCSARKDVPRGEILEAIAVRYPERKFWRGQCRLTSSGTNPVTIQTYDCIYDLARPILIPGGSTCQY